MPTNILYLLYSAQRKTPELLGVAKRLLTGVANRLAEVRAMIDRSFPAEIFEPQNTDQWERHVARIRHYTEMVYA